MAAAYHKSQSLGRLQRGCVGGWSEHVELQHAHSRRLDANCYRLLICILTPKTQHTPYRIKIKTTRRTSSTKPPHVNVKS